MAENLVTGGAGWIGSHVVGVFEYNDYEIVTLNDLSTGRVFDHNLTAKHDHTFVELTA